MFLMSYKCRPCAPLYSMATTELWPSWRCSVRPQNCVCATWMFWSTLRGLTGGNAQACGRGGHVEPLNGPRLLTDRGWLFTVTVALFGTFWTMLKVTLPKFLSYEINFGNVTFNIVQNVPNN